MFVREKPIGPYRYVYLVESVRENGRTKQRIIKNLGRKEQVAAKGDLDRLARSAARLAQRSMILSLLDQGGLPTLTTRRIGPPLAFERLWRETGCRAVVEDLAAARGFGFSPERACFLTVLHRLMVSGSDRAADAWRDDYRIEGTEGLALHHLYRTMAWLGAELPAVFLDTTSLYFEGAGGETLGQRGHSKDHRPDLMQMIVAVVMDQRGRPICCEMWPGNTTDVTALMPVVDRLGRRFGIPRVCVVADRGMISAETIAALEARGLEYILGVRERTTKEVHTLVLDDDAPFVPLLIPRQGRPDTELEAKAVTLGKRRYVVCRNLAEAEKDAAERVAIVTNLRRALKAGDKALVGNAGYRRFLKAPEVGFAVDEARVAEDARFDGVFVLRTNTTLDPLQEVEVAQDEKRFVLRTPVTGCAGKLFQTLGIALPPNIRDAAPQAATLAEPAP